MLNNFRLLRLQRTELIFFFFFYLFTFSFASILSLNDCRNKFCIVHFSINPIECFLVYFSILTVVNHISKRKRWFPISFFGKNSVLCWKRLNSGFHLSTHQWILFSTHESKWISWHRILKSKVKKAFFFSIEIQH